ncbi:MAG: EF-hand domain-containing protein [Prochlorothrix sp.]
MYDASSNGHLDRKDLEAIVNKAARIKNWSSRSAKYQTLLYKYMDKWDSLEKTACNNKKHQVTLPSWLDYHEALIQDPQRYAAQVHELMEIIFDVFDADGNGEISGEEWACFLSLYNISPVYATFVFPKLDLDQDGLLRKADLTELIRQFYFSEDPQSPGNLIFGPFRY